MKRFVLPLLIALVAAVWLMAQSGRVETAPRWEYRQLLPQEISPARYKQVEEWEIRAAANEGWELVGVSPFVYLNEERGAEGQPKRMVTQTYPGFYFKRLRRDVR